MTDEEIKALLEAKESAEKAAQEAKASLEGVVNELKELRKKRDQEPTINNQPDVNQVVENALKAREEAERQASFERALAEFKTSKSEFATDTTGLVFSRFQETLKKFNLSDLRNKEDAKQRLEEVYRFANFQGTTSSPADYEGTPQTGTAVPSGETKLKKELQTVLETTGLNEEKFKNLQKKFPDALSSLGLN